MERVLEPELMDDERQSIAYAKADFSTSNQLFVDNVFGTFQSPAQRCRYRVRAGRRGRSGLPALYPASTSPLSTARHR